MNGALSRGGTAALDGRSSAARAIARWKAEVAADLGDDLSTAERTLLEAAAGDVALLVVADAWLKENAGQVVNRRRRTFVPLVAERLRVASHLAELLKILGTKRRPPQVDALTRLRTWKARELPAAPVPAEVVAPPGEEKAKPEGQAPAAQEIVPGGGKDEAEVVVVEARPAPEPAPRQETKQERCPYCAGRGRLGKGTMNAPWTPCPYCQPKPPKPEPVVAEPGDAGAHLAATRATMGRAELAAQPSEFLDLEAEIDRRDGEAAKIWGPRN
jgi:hypothetical protein